MRERITFEFAKDIGLLDSQMEHLLLTPIPKGMKSLIEEKKRFEKKYEVDKENLTLKVDKKSLNQNKD